MKKVLMCLVVVMVSLLAITGCKEKDAVKFKNEYEELNGGERNGHTIRSIEIPKDNPIVYSSEEEIYSMMAKDGSSFIVYFGFPSCPWCRSVLPTMIDKFKENGIEKVYYVDVTGIRDTIVNNNGEFETTVKGSDGYYELLTLLGNVLSDYTLTDADGNKVSVGEKRIYAPNIISVVHGTATKMIEGISPLQTDGYMTLTDEMKSDMESAFQEFIDSYISDVSTCEIGGC